MVTLSKLWKNSLFMITKEVRDLVKLVREKRSSIPPARSMLVAVSGIDGSGKGYITAKIVSELNEQGIRAIAINIDPWLTPPEKRFNLDNPAEHFYCRAFPFDDLFRLLIHPFQQNRSIYLETVLTGELGNPFVQIYDFQDVDVILLEGIFLLTRSLRHNYDLTFWIECSFETALERALERNQEDLPPELIVRGYHTIYFPAQKFHFAVDEPKSSVDAIYMNDFRFDR